MAIDHFGITAPGRSWETVESGIIARDGRLPMNPSGGLDRVRTSGRCQWVRWSSTPIGK